MKMKKKKLRILLLAYLITAMLMAPLVNAEEQKADFNQNSTFSVTI